MNARTKPSRAPAGASAKQAGPGLSLILVLIIFSVSLFLFLPAMKGDFLWDDKYFIVDNPHLQGPHFLKTLFTTPFGGPSGLDKASRELEKAQIFYRPLTSLSYWADFKIWGMNAAGFHLTNILLHAANSLLVLSLLLAVGAGLAPAFFGALFFSVFPVHFESVSWISGRTDLLAFFFAALSAVFFLKWRKNGLGRTLLFSGILFFCSLLAKESLAILPVLFVLLMFREGEKSRRMLSSIVPHLIALLIWLGLRAQAVGLGGLGGAGRSIGDALAAVGFYSFRLLFPFNLSLTINAFSVFKNPGFQALGGAIVILGAVSLFPLKAKKRSSLFAFALVAFLVLLLPAVLVAFSPFSISLLAWRFLYIPSLVLVVGLSHLLFRLFRRSYVPMILGALLAAFFSLEVYPWSNQFGRKEADFWLSLKRPEREDVSARINVGLTMLGRDEARAKEIFESILDEKGHPLYDTVKTRIYEELASFYITRKDAASAEPYVRMLLQEPAQSLHFVFVRADFLALSGKPEEGEQLILDVLRRYPGNHLVLVNAAKFYLGLDNTPRAIELLERDHKLFPTLGSRALIESLKSASRKSP